MFIKIKSDWFCTYCNVWSNYRKVGILKTQATTNQACCACIPYQSNFSQYLFYLLIALREYFKEKSWGAAQPNISKEIIIKTPFALPPLKEQEEIVSTVETLLAKVTELENQIQDRKSLSDKLIFGIIKENLEGVRYERRITSNSKNWFKFMYKW